jgi:ABC-type bacteriocin/lantibiotic exporter with double-glycine peptidase domain
MTSDEFLQHWGIPGMKWGRRKAKNATPIKPHNDYSVADKIRKKDIREMSNEELKTLTARIQLEKQYKEASKKQVSRGKQFVQSFVENFARQTLNTVLASLVTKGFSLTTAGAVNIASEVLKK